MVHAKNNSKCIFLVCLCFSIALFSFESHRTPYTLDISIRTCLNLYIKIKIHVKYNCISIVGFYDEDFKKFPYN